MRSLLLVKHETAADAASPEARYQLGVLVTEARRVWQDVEVRHLPPTAPVGDIGDRDVLRIATGSVLVTRRSLAAMASKLAEGVAIVRPLPLAGLLGDADPPPYTLRGFEALEDRFFSSAETSLLRGATAGSPPVALLAPAAAERLLAGGGREPAFETEAVELAGLCHHFVDYHGVVREDVLPFLPGGVRDVLEVGCGAGGTGRLLQERLGCRVTGVELNPAAAAAAAAHLHRVVCGDVAAVELEGSYDAVVALELFEHLPEAEVVLGRLAGLVRPGGRIVLSVPNVGHHAVVTDLLAGRWDYLAIGLLCYTHYRFFTRRTLADWFERLGFHTVALVPQPTELPAVFARADWHGLELDRESLATKGFYVLIDL